jgi:hypothetical protein
VLEQFWPEPDPKLLKGKQEKEVAIMVLTQLCYTHNEKVQGKWRGSVVVPADANQADIEKAVRDSQLSLLYQRHANSMTEPDRSILLTPRWQR